MYRALEVKPKNSPAGTVLNLVWDLTLIVFPLFGPDLATLVTVSCTFLVLLYWAVILVSIAEPFELANMALAPYLVACERATLIPPPTNPSPGINHKASVTSMSSPKASSVTAPK